MNLIIQNKVYFNEAIEVAKRVEILKSNAVSGLILVVVFLFIFLPFRIGIASALSLPLAVLGTLGVMSLMGMSLNSITVLALIISIGMLVDNSVVISENYETLIAKGYSPIEAALESVKKLWAAITASALTTIAAFLPMLVTKGVMGKFIGVIPVVVTASLLISLIESFTLLPMRVVSFAGRLKVKQSVFDRIFMKFSEKFCKLLRRALALRYWAIAGFFLLIFISGLFMFKFNKFILFPADETEEYLVRFEMPRGTTVEETLAHANELSAQIQSTLKEKVKSIVGTVGEQRSRPDDIKGADGAYLGLLRIKVNDETKYNVPYYEVLKLLREIPKGDFETLHFEEVLNGPPVGNAIQARFQSNDSEKLDQMIHAVFQDIESIDGVKNLRIDDVIGEDEIFVDINYEFAKRLNLDVAYIGHSIRTAVAGRIASELNLKNQDVNVFLRFDDHNRRNLEDLKQLKIQDRNGRLFDLQNIATFKQQQGSSQIKHYNYKRSRSLVGDINDQVITTEQINKFIQKSYREHSKNIKGVTLYQGGAAESSAESMQSLASATILALIAIFGLLVFIFDSFVTPFIVMSTIPLGLFGFSVAFFFHGRPTSFLALIGVIGLAGIIVNSAIVLISSIEQLRKEQPGQNLRDVLVETSGNRLRAVIVTSLTTICGLLPTAYGIGGQDFLLIPMTLAMAWGLTTGTLLTLLWIPCAYYIVDDLSTILSNIMKKLQYALKQKLPHSISLFFFLFSVNLFFNNLAFAQDEKNHPVSFNEEVSKATITFPESDDRYDNYLRLSTGIIHSSSNPSTQFLEDDSGLASRARWHFLLGFSHEVAKINWATFRSVYLTYDVGYSRDERVFHSVFGTLQGTEHVFNLDISPELNLYTFKTRIGSFSLNSGPQLSMYILAVSDAGIGVNQSNQYWMSAWQANLKYQFLRRWSLFTKYKYGLNFSTDKVSRHFLSSGIGILL